MPANFVRRGAAAPEAIDALRATHKRLPARYLEFLSRWNGAEGDLATEPGWFVVWPAEEALVASEEYEVPVWLPGHFVFGSNGGGELFVFAPEHEEDDPPVYMVPAIGMELQARIQVAASWSQFALAMGQPFNG